MKADSGLAGISDKLFRFRCGHLCAPNNCIYEVKQMTSRAMSHFNDPNVTKHPLAGQRDGAYRLCVWCRDLARICVINH